MSAPPMDGRLREFYATRGLLFKIHMDLLYACDLDCHHCYLEDKKRPQTSAQDIIRILAEAAALGAMQVTFSGGEIFLRKDLFEILEAARRLRFHIRLKTHGGNLTREHAQRIKDLGIASVDFSVYALDEAPHDAFTQVKGSLKRTLHAIELLLDHDIMVEVKCSVTSFNKHYYREVFEHFRARGLSVSLNTRIRGTNSINTSTYPLNLSHEDKVRLEIYRLQQDGGPAPRRPIPPAADAHFCYAGRTALYVAPDLRVYPCTAWPIELGSLRHQSLSAIWSGPGELPAARALTRADTGVCDGCAARSHCSYCPGVAFIESGGDPVKPPALICGEAFAKLEAENRYLDGERATPHGGQPRAKKAHFSILQPNAEPSAGCGGC